MTSKNHHLYHLNTSKEPPLFQSARDLLDLDGDLPDLSIEEDLDLSVFPRDLLLLDLDLDPELDFELPLLLGPFTMPRELVGDTFLLLGDLLADLSLEDNLDLSVFLGDFLLRTRLLDLDLDLSLFQ